MHANHPPVVRLPHADRLTFRSGQRVNLSSLGTSDPDGGSVSYHWFQYPEAGTCTADIKLSGVDDLYERSFQAPKVERTCEAHFILKLTDKGSPPLSRNRRVVVTVQPEIRCHRLSQLGQCRQEGVSIGKECGSSGRSGWCPYT